MYQSSSGDIWIESICVWCVSIFIVHLAYHLAVWIDSHTKWIDSLCCFWPKFCICHPLSDVKLKSRVKSSKEYTGNSRIWKFKKHQIQGVLEVWGSVLHMSWRIRALIWRNSCKHCNLHLLHSVWPWWRRTSSSRVDVALSEDGKGWTAINTGVLSLFPYPFYFLILLVINWIIDRLIASVD